MPQLVLRMDNEHYEILLHAVAVATGYALQQDQQHYADRYAELSNYIQLNTQEAI